jgi:hypothetical protein
VWDVPAVEVLPQLCYTEKWPTAMLQSCSQPALYADALLVAKTGVRQFDLAMNEIVLNLNAEGDETQASSQGNTGG